MKHIGTILILSAALAGCSVYRVSSENTSKQYHASKTSAEDVVYQETIDRPHEMIGVVMVNTERRQRMSEVLERIKKEAAILGGDVVTNLKSDATGTWKKLPVQDFIGNAYIRANVSASVAVFK